MKRKLIALLAVSIFVFPTFSFADEIHERVKNANEQIERGIRSGNLTKDEARRLRGELKKVRDDETRMKADGRLNSAERARLEKELDRLERLTNRARSNDDRKDYRR